MATNKSLLFLVATTLFCSSTYANPERREWVYRSFDGDAIRFESGKGGSIHISANDVTQLDVGCEVESELCINSNTFAAYLPANFEHLESWDLSGISFVNDGVFENSRVLGVELGKLYRIRVKKPYVLPDETKYRYFSFLYSKDIGLVAFKETRSNYAGGTYYVLVGTSGVQTDFKE
jgi:hypothetical protein